jgi:hypothetical protein
MVSGIHGCSKTEYCSDTINSPGTKVRRETPRVLKKWKTISACVLSFSCSWSSSEQYLSAGQRSFKAASAKKICSYKDYTRSYATSLLSAICLRVIISAMKSGLFKNMYLDAISKGSLISSSWSLTFVPMFFRAV